MAASLAWRLVELTVDSKGQEMAGLRASRRVVCWVEWMADQMAAKMVGWKAGLKAVR
jgi:hypothetical protein